MYANTSNINKNIRAHRKDKWARQDGLHSNSGNTLKRMKDIDIVMFCRPNMTLSV